VARERHDRLASPLAHGHGLGLFSRLDEAGRRMLTFWLLLAATVASVLVVTQFGFETLSAVRAYVGGEGLWSKGQKDAVNHLMQFARSRDPADYARFRRALDIPLGDRQARLELEQPQPDYARAADGFRRGGNDPADFSALITFFRRFRHVGYVAQAIDIWAAGDSGIDELASLGLTLRVALLRPHPDRARADSLVAAVGRLNGRLTALEERFSASLGAGARWARRVLSATIVAVALSLIVGGGLLSWRGARRMRATEKERRALETQLRQAQKMEAVGQLTGGIAHDFNNLLTVIISNAELLSSALPHASSDLHDHVHDIAGAASRGAAMVRKLLAFSRAGQLEIRSVDLNVVLTDLSTILRRLLPEHIEVEIVATNGPLHLRADAGAVEQILLNLATNARDAMPHGGKLRIVTAIVELDAGFRDVVGGTAPPGRYATVAVSDTGTGMDATTRDRMLEPFFTTKPPGQGSGLGMAIVFGLMRQHGGMLRVETEPARGTTVRLYFPAAAEGATSAPPPTSAPPAGGSETILLVEDEPDIRRIAQRALERAGYRVLLAGDGVDALERLRQQPSDVHLVVSDVVMPRLGGPELRDAVRATGCEVPFLFMSGYAARDARGPAELAPGALVLHKPWTVVELLRRVRQTLDKAAGRA
jgi:signal transduction histidine kinase